MNFSLGLALGVASTYVKPAPPPSGTWILSTGLWDDVGVWRDDLTWID